jgi:hypothetical protein
MLQTLLALELLADMSIRNHAGTSSVVTAHVANHVSHTDGYSAPCCNEVEIYDL